MIKWKLEFRNLISEGQDSDSWNDQMEAVSEGRECATNHRALVRQIACKDNFITHTHTHTRTPTHTALDTLPSPTGIPNSPEV